jgi:hypothetical protein
MCTVLPPGVNPIEVNKYINYQLSTEESESADEMSQSMLEMDNSPLQVRRVVASAGLQVRNFKVHGSARFNEFRAEQLRIATTFVKEYFILPKYRTVVFNNTGTPNMHL